jgi:hypothetical protein
MVEMRRIPARLAVIGTSKYIAVNFLLHFGSSQNWTGTAFGDCNCAFSLSSANVSREPRLRLDHIQS